MTHYTVRRQRSVISIMDEMERQAAAKKPKAEPAAKKAPSKKAAGKKAAGKKRGAR